MEDVFGISWDTAIVYGSAITAALTFLMIALPFLKMSEKKEQYRSVIEKRRRNLFEATREQAENRGRKEKDHTAAENIAMLFKIQTLAGDASTKARILLLRAGIRSPMAPLVYLVSRIVVPVVFAALAMMFLAAMEKDIPEGGKASIIFGAALFGFFLPRIILKNSADKRQQEIALAFPDALDMMLICVQGGIGIEAAINRIADAIADHSTTLAEEMGLLSAELGMLNDRRGAFQGFADRVGSGSARSFATAMLQAEQYGTSISKALRVLADEQRDQRMAAAEQKAAALPPKLTVPMILFFLPALFIVILGPAFLSIPK